MVELGVDVARLLSLQRSDATASFLMSEIEILQILLPPFEVVAVELVDIVDDESIQSP